MALLPANYREDITPLHSRLNSLHIWLCENGMALNSIKSVAVLFGTLQRLKSLSSLSSVNVAGATIPLSEDPLAMLGSKLQWNLTLRLYPTPAFITFGLSNKLIHPLTTTWFSLWHQHLFLHDCIG